MSYLVDNIRMRMEALNLTPVALSKRAGLNHTAVRDILTGKSKSPRAGTIEKLAKVLDCSASDLIDPFNPEKSPIVAPIPVIGTAEAENWKKEWRWPEKEWAFTPIPIDQRFRGLSRFCLLIHGDSMDQVYQDGNIVVAIALEELNEIPSSGRRYVVHRHKDGLVETTIKEYFVDENKQSWLISKSNHPAHQSPIKLDNATTKTNTVEIYARVTSVFKNEP